MKEVALSDVEDDKVGAQMRVTGKAMVGAAG